MSEVNQHQGAVNLQAMQEIEIMSALLDGPKTPAQLCNEFKLPTNRVAYLLRGLRAAQCIGKVPGSHAIELLAPF